MSARVPPTPADKPAPATEEQRKAHIEDLLDEALAETFPASDPLAITIPRPSEEDDEEGTTGTPSS